MLDRTCLVADGVAGPGALEVGALRVQYCSDIDTVVGVGLSTSEYKGNRRRW